MDETKTTAIEELDEAAVEAELETLSASDRKYIRPL